MRRCWGALILLLLVAVAPARDNGLSWTTDGKNLLLTWSHHDGQEITLYRSTQAFHYTDLKDGSFPISKLGTVTGTCYLDTHLAPNATYYYTGETDDGWWYQANPAKLPPQKLPQQLADVWILIDKQQYCLEVYAHGQMQKRYPVSFGVCAQKRKLRQDRASTPEGRYLISGRQPKSRWHKAYDINYPTLIDKARLRLLAPGQDIGGEIQIHGGGIEDNWTWGCIGMRNVDIDELFGHPEIGRDTVVWIVGKELTFEDLECDESAEPLDPFELGRWQRENHLPVTCLQDKATRDRLSPMR